ncbi:MAG: ABC transporter ATP-binding protein [Chloroflexi bacterium]|nr:ABC transporter ATP-binding protein [Chloroflexota bacterium]
MPGEAPILPVVELIEATKTFGPVKALDQITLRVARGEAVAVLGPNGAGKTTAISLMLGLRTPTAGCARLFGRDPREPSSRERVGVMLQESGVPATLTVREVLELFRRLYRRPLSAGAALAAAGLDAEAGARVGNLSGGQRQRLYFALAIAGNPEVLFLDEPTVGLDVQSRCAFWRRIRQMVEAGKTLVLTTHYLEEADALADRIVVIDRGRIIAEGSPAAIKSQVGGKTIRFRAPGASEDDLQRLPGVRRIHRAADRFTLYATEPEALLAHLFQAGLAITDLEVVGISLDEAFLTLTGDRITEETERGN